MALWILMCGIGTIAAIGWWILMPIDRRGKARKAPVQFSVGDFLCLFIIMQLPLIVTHFMPTKFVNDQERHFVWIFAIATWIMAPVIWFSCARALSKAAINNGLHRFIFLGLVVPFVYYTLIPFLFVMVETIQWFASGKDPRGDGPTIQILFVWLGLASLFFLCGLFTRWIVHQSREAITLN